MQANSLSGQDLAGIFEAHCGLTCAHNLFTVNVFWQISPPPPTDQPVSKKPWGGVFQVATDRRVEKFTESVSFDQRLFPQDIECSIAHAKMLARVGILTEVECQKIVHGLADIRQEFEQGHFQFSTELEDVHMHIEKALIDRLGDLGRKLHTARSRNDQVATDMRVWVRGSIDEVETRLIELQTAFVARCERDAGVIVPGYTHLRRAQPILAPHYWLAYCEKFARDRERLINCRSRVNVLPLGSAALAGTSLEIDREFVANELGFEKISGNSLDATSDRDFLVEAAFALSMIAEHLSGWAEEWILWSTTEFAFLSLPQEFCTGSSIMPQKVNPDVLELIRGKSARVIGNLVQLLVLIKGLPLAYNRDLQEDKEPLFDSFDTIMGCLDLAAPLVAGARLNVDRIQATLEDGFLDATTLMEHLIRQGMPQRSAHEAVGKLVRMAMEKSVRLCDLPAEEFERTMPGLGGDVQRVLGVKNAIAAFKSSGSTAPDRVADQIAIWREKLATEQVK